MSKTTSKLTAFLEYFIITAIIGVLIHTCLFELHHVMRWSYDTRRLLIITGFAFDLLFSIEYIVRSIAARKGHGFKRYMLYERGWVDLMSSLPLLILDSGPSLYLVMFPEVTTEGGLPAILNSLKTIKAIRVTRILRLLRVLKIFGKIQNTESVMATRHIATISTISIVTIITVLSLFSTFQSSLLEDIQTKRFTEYKGIMNNAISQAKAELKAKGQLKDRKLTAELIKKYTRVALGETPVDILMIVRSDNSNIILQNARHQYIMEHFQVEYSPAENVYKFFDTSQVSRLKSDDGRFTMLISDLDFLDIESRFSLIFFSIIIMLVLAYMLVYTRHFAQTISDPIDIMRRGMVDADFNLEVLVYEQYSDDETFRLAEAYNEKWLPAKMKETGDTSAGSNLTLEDFLGAGGPSPMQQPVESSDDDGVQF